MGNSRLSVSTRSVTPALPHTNGGQAEASQRHSGYPGCTNADLHPLLGSWTSPEHPCRPGSECLCARSSYQQGGGRGPSTSSSPFRSGGANISNLGVQISKKKLVSPIAPLLLIYTYFILKFYTYYTTVLRSIYIFYRKKYIFTLLIWHT